VIFSSNRSGNLDLWEVSTKTGAVRRITDDPAEDWDPAFTPDGRIIWSSNRSGNFEIWMAEPDGSGARQVTRDGEDAENATASPDGRWIVYNSAHPSKIGLWKIRPDGSEASRLVAAASILPEVSPDGRYVLYRDNFASGVAKIRVIRIADGAPVPFEIQCQARSNLNLIGRARWMPDGRAIAFIGQDQRGVHGVFVQDFVPGKDTSSSRKPLGGFDPEMATESFGISPDGSRMTVASWEQLFSLMLAERVPGIAAPARK
jgi:TolB protein